MRTLPPTDLRQSSSEQEYMPLLRSLADDAVPVAINMALLMELSALSPPLNRVKDACKVQELAPAFNDLRRLKAGASSTHSKRFATSHALRLAGCRPSIGANNTPSKELQ
jgi:hypothetical protein